MSGNLATILTNSAAKHGDRLALKLDDAEFNYALLDQASARVATMLKAKGLQPGDRVGIMLPNVPYFPVAYYGVLRAGGVVVPMNVLLKGREVGYYLKDPGAKIMFAWHDFLEAAQTGAAEAGAEIIEVKPGEIEPLIFAHEPDPDVADRRRRRHRGHPLHLGHDRPAQGRRADPRQPAEERRDRGRRCSTLDETVVDARRAAAVPLLRPDLRHERHDRWRAAASR